MNVFFLYKNLHYLYQALLLWMLQNFSLTVCCNLYIYIYYIIYIYIYNIYIYIYGGIYAYKGRDRDGLLLISIWSSNLFLIKLENPTFSFLRKKKKKHNYRGTYYFYFSYFCLVWFLSSITNKNFVVYLMPRHPNSSSLV